MDNKNISKKKIEEINKRLKSGKSSFEEHDKFASSDPNDIRKIIPTSERSLLLKKKIQGCVNSQYAIIKLCSKCGKRNPLMSAICNSRICNNTSFGLPFKSKIENCLECNNKNSINNCCFLQIFPYMSTDKPTHSLLSNFIRDKKETLKHKRDYAELKEEQINKVIERWKKESK